MEQQQQIMDVMEDILGDIDFDDIPMASMSQDEADDEDQGKNKNENNGEQGGATEEKQVEAVEENKHEETKEANDEQKEEGAGDEEDILILSSDDEEQLAASCFKNLKSSSSQPQASSSSYRFEPEPELIDLDDDDIWKPGQEHEYTDDDLQCADEDGDDGDKNGDMNNGGIFANDKHNKPDADGLILVNVGCESRNEKPIYLPPQITATIMPHQIGGIRFMFKNVIESIDKFKKSDGAGCILAHSMGLGKTIQTISFVDIFLSSTPARHVLIIVPINTIQNWVSEFNHWFPPQPSIQDSFSRSNHKIKYRTFQVFELSDCKSTLARIPEIVKWRKLGGVLLVGYEMYRLLSEMKNLISKKGNQTQAEIERSKKDITEALIDPGPDLIICDEGHRIKNDLSMASMALKRIKTRRRIVLTGYPIQNNLMEYWCMVDFVKPGYLGSKEDFNERFSEPIRRGQFIDATDSQKTLMRKRAYVLTDLVKEFVQRRSHDILCRSLPEKHEHVFLLRMTHIQKLLMLALFDHLKAEYGASFSMGQVSRKSKTSPIVLFSICNKIWNHPDILYSVVREGKNVLDLDDDPDDNYRSGHPSSSSKPKKHKLKSNIDPSIADPHNLLNGSTANTRTLDYSWADPVFQNYTPGVLGHSYKMVLLLELIEQTINANEKLLIFSQSLLTLNLIERYLADKNVPGTSEQWSKHVNYLRIDGSTGTFDRERYINRFNSDFSTKLFLLSTRAGCLGINLVGASRIVIFDVSWNPCHDAQAACRIYRYGQTRKTYIYRLVADNSLEKKVYDRQIAKQGMANRVVDEENPETVLTQDQVQSLIKNLDTINEPPILEIPENEIDQYPDITVQDICRRFYHIMTSKPFKHESLLLHDQETALGKEDKLSAKLSYMQERQMKKSYQNYQPQPWNRPNLNLPPLFPGPPIGVTSTPSGFQTPLSTYSSYQPQPLLSQLLPMTSNSNGGNNLSMIPRASYLASNQIHHQSQEMQVRQKLNSRGFQFFKSTILKQDVALQEKATGGTTSIRQGETVHVFRNALGSHMVLTRDCKVIEVRPQTAAAFGITPTGFVNQQQLNFRQPNILRPNGPTTSTMTSSNGHGTSSTIPKDPEIIFLDDDD